MPRPNNRTPNVVALDVEAVRLRAQGKTFQQIADAIGDANKGTSSKRVKRVLERVQVEAADELRARERAILEATRTKLIEIVYGSHVVVSNGKVTDEIDHTPVIAAIRELRQISESLRKLDGLDAPSRSEVRVTDDLTAEIQELALELGLAGGDVGADRRAADRSEERTPGPAPSPA